MNQPDSEDDPEAQRQAASSQTDIFIALCGLLLASIILIMGSWQGCLIVVATAAAIIIIRALRPIIGTGWSGLLAFVCAVAGFLLLTQSMCSSERIIGPASSEERESRQDTSEMRTDTNDLR